MNYIFKTTATMKEYNNKKWWIDGDIISDMRINADSVENALEIYRVGYVITGKTEFDKGDYTGYSTQYIDLWVTVLTVVDTVF